MKNRKEKTLAGKLTLWIFIALSFVFIMLIIVITDSVKKDLIKREMHTLELLAQQNANIAGNLMNEMLNKQEVIIVAINTSKSAEPEVRKQVLTELLERVNEEQEDILSLFFVAEPNTFLPNTPDGFSIVASSEGTHVQNDRFTYYFGDCGIAYISHF